ncbi:MAG: hypothetical protein K1X79_05475 [Oligoflexia bacterium]|nr:hypothetical protein [Oligoflexia bacterium]
MIRVRFCHPRLTFLVLLVFMRRLVIQALSLILSALPTLDCANAISVDEFDSPQALEAKPPQGVQYSLATTSGLGGTRAIEAFADPSGSAFAHLLTIIDFGFLSHSQDNDILGYQTLSWDGDTQAAVLSRSGLGTFDLLQDSSSAFRFEIISFDYPNGKSINLVVSVFDSLDTSKASQATLVLNQSINTPPGNPAIFDLPFSFLTPAPGASGLANLHQIGAITLRIDGMDSPAADLQIDWFGTNGICRNPPNAQGKVIDECGVCAGDNSSCADCSGVPNGNATLDRCNICNGDGMSCLGCNEENIAPLLAAMDGGAKKIEKRINSMVKVLLKYQPSAKNKTFATKTNAAAHKLQVRNWILSWTIPADSVVCSNTAFCSSASNDPYLQEYRQHNDELLALAKSVQAKLKKLGVKAIKSAAGYYSQAGKIHKENLDMTYKVPTGKFSCSAP